MFLVFYPDQTDLLSVPFYCLTVISMTTIGIGACLHAGLFAVVFFTNEPDTICP